MGGVKTARGDGLANAARLLRMHGLMSVAVYVPADGHRRRGGCDGSVGWKPGWHVPLT